MEIEDNRPKTKTCGPIALTVPALIGIGVGAFAVTLIVVLSVVLTLPETYSCWPEDTKYFVIKVEKPVLTSVEPPMVCTDYAPRGVRVNGTGFHKFGSLVPNVEFNRTKLQFVNSSECFDVEIRNSEKLSTCNTFQTIIPVIAVHDIAYPKFEITDPENAKPHGTASTDKRDSTHCAAETTQLVTIVPPPRLLSMYPFVMCVNAEYDPVITGQILLEAKKTSNVEYPSVRVLSTPAGVLQTVSTVGSCQVVNVSRYASVRSCGSLTYHIDTTSVPFTTNSPEADLQVISVTNPPPADCTSREVLQFRVVRPPNVTAVVPHMICLEDQDRVVELQGSGFVWVNGQSPDISLGNATVVVQSALPTVDNKAADQCTYLGIQGHNVWICSKIQIRVLRQKGLQEISWPVITVRHPNLPLCGNVFHNLLTVTPPPMLTDSRPPILCSAGAIGVTLRGENFFQFSEPSMENSTMLPVVSSPAIPVTVLPHANCSTFPVDVYGTVQRCDVVDLLLNTTQVPADYAVRKLSVVNSFPLNCAVSLQPEFSVVPLPSVTSTTPDLLCVGTSTDLTLHGSDFIWVNDLPPLVSISGVDVPVVGVPDSSCTNYTVLSHFVQRCSSLVVHLTVGSPDFPEPYNPIIEIAFRWSPQCKRTFPVSMILISPPTLELLQPTLCLDAFPQYLTVTGVSFVVIIDSQNVTHSPVFALSGSPVSSAQLQDCSSFVPFRNFWVRGCRIAVLEVASGGITNSSSLSLTNPPPLNCGATFSSPIIQVPGQSVSAAIPSEVCSSSFPISTTVRLSGSFVNYVTPPPVYVGSSTQKLEANIPDDATCTRTNVTETVWYAQCDVLEVVVPGELLSNIGSVNIIVKGPCSPVSFGVNAVPTSAITAAIPALVCETKPHTVTLFGENFVTSGSTPPGVRIIDSVNLPLMGSNVENSGLNCTVISSGTITVCPMLTFDYVPSVQKWQPGVIDLTVVNSNSGVCGVSNNSVLQVVPKPVVNRSFPLAFCQDTGSTLNVYGHYFSSWTSFVAFNVPTSTRYVPSSSTTLDSTTLGSQWDANYLPPRVYDIEVSNPDGCTTILSSAFEVHPRLLVLFVDPPVVYNGISMQITVFATGLKNQVKFVDIVNGSSGETLYRFGQNETSFPNGQPNRINLVISKGFPVGLWDVHLTSEIGCVNTARSILRVVSEVGVSMDAVDPTFVWVNATSTTVLISSLPLPSFENFLATPKVYLSPNNASALSVGQPLSSVAFNSPLSLNAVLRAGLGLGWYDMILVNPVTFKVGYLPKALKIIARKPPAVQSVSPSSIPRNYANPIQITGTDFSTSLSGNTVSFACSNGLTYMQNNGIPIVALSSTSLIIPVPLLPDAGVTCTVVLARNDADNPSVRFNLIYVRNPSFKLDSFELQLDHPLQEARRGLLLAHGNAGNKYLWAVGGDGGGNGSVVLGSQSIECSKLNNVGTPGRWRSVRSRLPQGVAFGSGVTIGQYIYLLGGRNSGGALSSVYRAQILNPSQTPNIELDLSVLLGPPTVFTAGGSYIYMVSAIFDGSWQANPSGESLPGEALSLDVPVIVVPGFNVSVVLQLVWDAIPGASGYNVYRTRLPGQNRSQVVLLTTVGVNFFDDDGTYNESVPASVPLAEGDLGKWATLATLNTPRYGLASTYLDHPTDPSRVFLYALQGASNTAALANYEFMTITITPPSALVESELQTTSGWTISTNASAACATCFASFSSPKAYLPVVRVDTDMLPTWSSNESALFLGPGTTFSNMVSAIEAATVHVSGYLRNLDILGSPLTPPTQGSCIFGSSNYIKFLVGTTISNSMQIGQLLGVSGSQSDTTIVTVGEQRPPDIKLASGGVLATTSVNPVAGSIDPPVRAYAGCVTGSGHLYLVGGAEPGRPVVSDVTISFL